MHSRPPVRVPLEALIRIFNFFWHYRSRISHFDELVAPWRDAMRSEQWNDDCRQSFAILFEEVQGLRAN